MCLCVAFWLVICYDRLPKDVHGVYIFALTHTKSDCENGSSSFFLLWWYANICLLYQWKKCIFSWMDFSLPLHHSPCENRVSVMLEWNKNSSIRIFMAYQQLYRCSTHAATAAHHTQQPTHLSDICLRFVTVVSSDMRAPYRLSAKHTQ